MNGVVLVLFVILGVASSNVHKGWRLAPATQEEIEENRKTMENEDMYQGDISNFDPEDRNAVRRLSRLWPSGRVYYVISSNLQQHKTLIEGAMKEYEDKTKGCISFHEGTGNGDYVSFEVLKGCYSMVGKTGGKQVLSLGQGCYYHKTILHELGHVLGLYHEHSRSDRDDYITIDYANVATSSQYNFRKLNKDQNYLFTTFDFKSIMMYGRKVFSKNGGDTIVPKDPKIKDFGNAVHLSAKDLITVSTLYNCLGYTHPPEKKLPGGVIYACQFKYDSCEFTNQPGYEKFLHISVGNDQYMTTTYGNKEYKLTSKVLPFSKKSPVDCISFRYKVTGQMKSCKFNLKSRVIGFSQSISVSPTGGWKTLNLNVHPYGEFKVTFDVVTGSNGRFALDEFQYKEGRC